jgi:hypothetical protein
MPVLTGNPGTATLDKFGLSPARWYTRGSFRGERCLQISRLRGPFRKRMVWIMGFWRSISYLWIACRHKVLLALFCFKDLRRFLL